MRSSSYCHTAGCRLPDLIYVALPQRSTCVGWPLTEFKTQVLAGCELPGASVAKVAMAHGINENVVHNWRKLARGASTAALPSPTEFMPVAIPAAPAQSAEDRGIEVELRRGAVTMKISWPLTAAGDCAAWRRDGTKARRILRVTNVTLSTRLNSGVHVYTFSQ